MTTVTQPIQLCIPKVSNEIHRYKISDIFASLNIGKIIRVSENPLRTNPNFKRVIISIDWNNDNPLALHIQNVLKNTNEHINIVYDMPWYWQIFAAINHQK